jgi:hypothetical protein
MEVNQAVYEKLMEVTPRPLWPEERQIKQNWSYLSGLIAQDDTPLSVITGSPGAKNTFLSRHSWLVATERHLILCPEPGSDQALFMPWGEVRVLDRNTTAASLTAWVVPKWAVSSWSPTIICHFDGRVFEFRNLGPERAIGLFIKVVRERVATATGPATTGPATSSSDSSTAPSPSRIERLEKLGDLFDRGLLSKEEFEAEKGRVLRDEA